MATWVDGRLRGQTPTAAAEQWLLLTSTSFLALLTTSCLTATPPMRQGGEGFSLAGDKESSEI